MDKYFVLNSQSTAIADIKINNETVKKLWNSFTLTMGEICFEKGEDFTFRLGNTQFPILSKEVRFSESAVMSLLSSFKTEILMSVIRYSKSLMRNLQIRSLK